MRIVDPDDVLRADSEGVSAEDRRAAALNLAVEAHNNESASHPAAAGDRTRRIIDTARRFEKFLKGSADGDG